LKDPLVQDRNAFAEKRLGYIKALHNLAGLEIHLPQRRPADKPGPLVKKPVAKFQPLGESVSFMRITFDNAIAVLLRGEASHKKTQKTQKDFL